MLSYLFGPTFLEKFLEVKLKMISFTIFSREKNINTSNLKTNKKEILKDIFISFFLETLDFQIHL